MNPLIFLGLGGLVLLLASNSKAAPAATPEKKSTGLIDLPNVPLEIATRTLKMSGVDGRAQIVWLNDNGWMRTASALDKFFAGDATEAEVLDIAKAAWSARLTGK